MPPPRTAGGEQRGRGFTLVEPGDAALADVAQRARQVLLHQHGAGLAGLAAIEEDGGGGRVLLKIRGGLAQHVHVALFEYEAAFGELDGGRDQFAARPGAVFLARVLQAGDGSRHTRRRDIRAC